MWYTPRGVPKRYAGATLLLKKHSTKHKPTHPRRTLCCWCGCVRPLEPCWLRSKGGWYVCLRLRVEIATLAACARRVVGMFAFDYVRACYARSLRSKDSWYVCVRLRVGLATLAACARRMVGMCAFNYVWGSLRSQPALEGSLTCVQLTLLESKTIG